MAAAAAVMVGPRLYSCCNCGNNVALHDDIISKSFQGKHGRAFLFSHAMNISTGPKEDRQLMTGLHTVADVFCSDCNETLGWKYERAYEEAQKYKEGKFILEKSKIAKDNWAAWGCDCYRQNECLIPGGVCMNYQRIVKSRLQF